MGDGITLQRRLDWDELDAFVATARGATFYHTATWLRSLAEVHGLGVGFFLRRAGGVLAGVLPFVESARLGLVHRQSLAFGTYGGAALAPDADDTLGPALRDAFMDSSGGRLQRLTLTTPPDPDRPDGPPDAPRRLVTQILDLRPGWDAVFADGFRKERRRQVRKALRAGVVVARSEEPDDVAAYHRIYLQHARDWKLDSPTPLAHLQFLVRDTQRVRFWVARHRGVLVGGHFNFHHRGAVIAWNGCASKAHRELAPSVLLYAMNLEQACADGETSFNFGGSIGKDPLFEFKAAFGARPVHYGLWRRDGVALRLLRAGRTS